MSTRTIEKRLKLLEGRFVPGRAPRSITIDVVDSQGKTVKVLTLALGGKPLAGQLGRD